jgi:hypothetical protein
LRERRWVIGGRERKKKEIDRGEEGIRTGTIHSIQWGGEHDSELSSTFLTGDNKKYTAVVDSVDMNFKRINVKAYNYPEILPKALGQTAEIDPSGTRVSIWDFNNGVYTKTYEIQHQMMTIQRNLDSTKQIIVGGNLYDPAVGTNWKDIYLTGYTNADNNEFITVKKDAIEQQKYEDAKLNTLNLSNVLSLQTILSAQLPLKDELKITI